LFWTETLTTNPGAREVSSSVMYGGLPGSSLIAMLVIARSGPSVLAAARADDDPSATTADDTPAASVRT
jgi:hypothetical protein